MQGDFTRLTFRKEKHYRDVRRQQGRVDLDADWNEQADITGHRIETEARDVIGPCGAPKHDAGFAISAPSSGSDFSIGKGRFYVDGILCENEADVVFTQQPDLPQTAFAPTAGRYLVYLDVWQRHLTALDDPEIREVALGGPDTATRTKTVWQVQMLHVGDHGAAVTCLSEPPGWKDNIAASTIKLTARVAKEEPSDKPCIVPPGAGYRRLENQLYRVEIHRAGTVNDPDQTKVTTFKWSRDNGSVAARIGAITVGGEITLTSARRDHALGLAEGQWIELLDDRNEWNRTPGILAPIIKIADLVLTVDTAQAIAPPGGLLVQFVTALDQKFHPKVRRWDSAGVTAATIPGTNDGFLPLEDGVEVKFASGTSKTGDYWLIPARTDHGDIEWPQDSASPSNPLPQLPYGIVHHFCRLAIIEVDASGDATLIEDCRPVFPPLTEIDDCCGCCTKTVGTTAKADYRSIQDAINSLPQKAGGHICVLDGDYSENVTIVDRQNITISGCGERTRIMSRAAVEENSSAPVIWIVDSLNIRIESLALIADESGNGVLVQGNVPIYDDTIHLEVVTPRTKKPTRKIWLAHLAITAALRSAIEVHDTDQVTICDCTIRMTDLNGARPGIFFQGESALIKRNTIALAIKAREHRNGSDSGREPSSAGAFALFRPEGVERASYGVSGIQLGGGSRLVRVLDNLIAEVTGQGITLGSLEEAGDENTPPVIIVGWPTDPADPCDRCAEPSTHIKVRFSDPHGRQKQLRSPDPLEQIYLERNRIWQTGLDGIGVIGFFDLQEIDEIVSVRGLTICGNEILGCLRRAPANIESAMASRMGYGGIALADVTELVIHDNVIEYTGLTHAQPVCGVFLVHGDGIDISRNRILNNGGQRSEKPSGPLGGVYIAMATAPVAVMGVPAEYYLGAGVFFGQNPIAEATGFPAVKVHDNIIGTPLGRALTIWALGPVSIVGNQLTSSGVVAQEKPTLFSPATVFIFDLGRSNEFYLQASFAAIQAQSMFKPLRTVESTPQTLLADGNVLFVDNQCSLDLLESGKSGAYASITILSLDDVAFENNQCDCNLALGEDFILTQAFLFATSLRVTGNRFKEGFFNSPLSAITLGLLNTTAHNQATHCLMILAPSAWLINEPNTIVITAFFEGFCSGHLGRTVGNFLDVRK